MRIFCGFVAERPFHQNDVDVKHVKIKPIRHHVSRWSCLRLYQLNPSGERHGTQFARQTGTIPAKCTVNSSFMATTPAKSMSRFKHVYEKHQP